MATFKANLLLMDKSKQPVESHNAHFVELQFQKKNTSLQGVPLSWPGYVIEEVLGS